MQPGQPPFDAVAAVLQRYFDGLYHGDTRRLGEVFHPQALYASATGGELLALDMARYFPVVDARPSPASRGEARQDRILRIEFNGPVTALAVVQCAIGERRFTDWLALLCLEGRWQVISKVFHFEAAAAAG
jgi:hypothetical protein